MEEQTEVRGTSITRGEEGREGERVVGKHILVDCFVVVQTRVAFPAVQATCEWRAELADDAVVGEAEVPQL